MSTIQEVMTHLESIAPRQLQESYDNSGLLTGNPSWKVSGALLTLDCTEEIVEEAIAQKCNLIIAHHPIVFKGLKSFTGKSYVERTVIKAIKNDVAIYALHTNLDNVHQGVNKKIAQKIGLVNCRILSPNKTSLSKLVTFVPYENVDEVLAALYKAGAGQIGDYKNCSFQMDGTGTFLPTEGTDPHIGTINKQEQVSEKRIEVLLPDYLSRQVLNSLLDAHPYEEVAYYLTKLENTNQDVGAGMVGDLPSPEEPISFLSRLKKVMNIKMVRHTALPEKSISKIAVCGGAGSFLLPEAKNAKADLFISADFKYHEFFDAEGEIAIADIGHYESEQFTVELFKELLSEKFTTFAIIFSKIDTNPISYF